MTSKRPLWICPKCGKKFVTRNMWHACGPDTVSSFLEGKGPKARTLFDGLVALIARCGPFEFAPAKTRVAFMARVRFAGVSALSERGMTVNFGLDRAMKHPRIAKAEYIASGWYGHRVRITDPKELDAELGEWLCESYRRMGRQERLTERGSRRSETPRRRAAPARPTRAAPSR